MATVVVTTDCCGEEYLVITNGLQLVMWLRLVEVIPSSTPSLQGGSLDGAMAQRLCGLPHIPHPTIDVMDPQIQYPIPAFPVTLSSKATPTRWTAQHATDRCSIELDFIKLCHGHPAINPWFFLHIFLELYNRQCTLPQG